MSKKNDVSLIPRYEGTSAIEYEKIGLTIRKTRLYKFIGVIYSQPRVIVNARHFYSRCSIIVDIFVKQLMLPKLYLANPPEIL